MVLTSMGDESRRWSARFPRHEGRVVCGNLTLEEIVGAPPLGRGTRAAIAVGGYRGRLTVCLRCDPFAFDTEDARGFLRVFMGTLFETSSARF